MLEDLELIMERQNEEKQRFIARQNEALVNGQIYAETMTNNGDYPGMTDTWDKVSSRTEAPVVHLLNVPNYVAN